MIGNDKVLVFRKYVLPYSETFIAAQGGFLARYHADYAGFSVDPTGKSLLPQSDCYVLSDYSRSLPLSKILYRLGCVNKIFFKDIQLLEPNVIHAHFLNDGMDAHVLSSKLSIPLVTTLHGHDIAKVEKWKPLRKSRKEFFAKVDKVIAVSDYIYEKALENGCPEEKLIKHHIGIDLENFKGETNDAENPEILFVGRLVEKKGCIYLLEAIKNLKNKYPDLVLKIIGDGLLRDDLVAYAKRYSLNVEFKGRCTQSQIREAMSSAWALIVPSVTAGTGDAEGLPMVVVEAQALKLPVIAFDSGGIAEGVEDGVTGFLIREKDVGGLSDKISYFLENKSEKDVFGEKGRQLVEKEFDVRKQCVLLEEIYDSVR